MCVCVCVCVLHFQYVFLNVKELHFQNTVNNR